MRLTLTVILSAALLGCGASEPVRPLDSGAFYGRRATVDPGAPRPAVGPVDESGRVDPIARSGRDSPGVSGISDVVADSVRPRELPAPATLPSTQPSTQPLSVAPGTLPSAATTLPTGQYMLVGVVVAEVDGQPIYSSKIMELVQKELSIKARELDDKAFRAYARDQIEKAKNELIRSELEYRAAQRSLSEDERRLARSLTTKWLGEQVAKAGGSEEQLRRRLRAEGMNLDEVLEDRHRDFMTQVYYQRKVIPLIVITADGMREYYEKSKDTEFSEKAGVSFRIIKISVKEVGDRERAMARANEIHAAAKSGQDFAKLAYDNNKEDYLRTSGGMPIEGLMPRGTWKVKAVEDAAWELEPGGISPVITVGDDLYIVKLEKKSTGRTEPFNSEMVQDRIRNTLRGEQFRALREKEQKKLESDAIIRIDRRSMNLTLDMAMQRYQQWRGT